MSQPDFRQMVIGTSIFSGTKSPLLGAQLASSATSPKQDPRIALHDAVDFDSSIISAHIGSIESGKRSFRVHERLFSSRSGFFARAVRQAKFDSKPCEIVMLEDDAAIFNLYVNLTYSGSVTTKGSSAQDPKEWASLVQLYVLAKKLEDPWAKNRIIDAMYFYLNNMVPKTPKGALCAVALRSQLDFETIVELYEGTKSGSPARRLVVDFYAHRGGQRMLEAGRGVLPIDFVFDLALCAMGKQPAPVFGDMIKEDLSSYHMISWSPERVKHRAGDKEEATRQ